MAVTSAEEDFQKKLELVENNDIDFHVWFVNRINFPFDTAMRFAHAVLKSNYLNILVMYNNVIPLEAATLLGAFLIQNKLKCLVLANARLQDEGSNVLFDGLSLNTSLNELRLDDNGIGPNPIRKLCSVLMVNTVIHTIDLQNNRMEDEGAYSIASVLLHNKTLTYLNISNNRIGDRGFKEIGDTLSLNDTLKSIYLQGNLMGDNYINVSVIIPHIFLNGTLLACMLGMDVNDTKNKANEIVSRNRHNHEIFHSKTLFHLLFAMFKKYPEFNESVDL